MRVLFVVTGVGYGDSIRSHAIIKALYRHNPRVKVMVAAYDNSYSYFKDKYHTVKISGYKLLGMSLKFKVLSFIANNYVLPYTWLSVSFKLKRLVRDFNPDVIVSDFEPAGIILGRLISRPSVVIFSYDPMVFRELRHKNNKLRLEALYFERLYDFADVTVIPSLAGKNQCKGHCYVHPIVITQPSELPSNSVLMRKLGLKRPPILVMLGGSSFGVNLARRLMRVVKNFDEDFIIFGSNVRMPKRKNVKHYPFKSNFVEYLKVCKGVITLGGNLTLSECLVYRKPMMVFPIKNHVEQAVNAYALRHVAMVKYNLKGLRRSVESFLRNIDSLRRKMPKVKDDGADEVVQIIRGLK